MVGAIHFPPLAAHSSAEACGSRHAYVRKLMGKSIELLGNLSLSVYRHPQFASAACLASTGFIFFSSNPLTRTLERLYEENKTALFDPEKRNYRPLFLAIGSLSSYWLLSSLLFKLSALEVDKLTRMAITAACVFARLWRQELSQRTLDEEKLRTLEKEKKENLDAFTKTLQEKESLYSQKEKETASLKEQLENETKTHQQLKAQFANSQLQKDELETSLKKLQEERAVEATNHVLELSLLAEKFKKEKEKLLHTAASPVESKNEPTLQVLKEIVQEGKDSKNPLLLPKKDMDGADVVSVSHGAPVDYKKVKKFFGGLFEKSEHSSADARQLHPAAANGAEKSKELKKTKSVPHLKTSEPK